MKTLLLFLYPVAASCEAWCCDMHEQLPPLSRSLVEVFLLNDTEDDILNALEPLLEQITDSAYLNHQGELVGETILHVAVEKGCSNVVTLLCKHGANPNIQDKTGSTPLHCAVRSNNSAIVQVLLEYGANPDTQDSIGATALHYATHKKLTAIAKLLLKNNADPSIKDIRGEKAEKDACSIEKFCKKRSITPPPIAPVVPLLAINTIKDNTPQIIAATTQSTACNQTITPPSTPLIKRHRLTPLRFSAIKKTFARTLTLTAAVTIYIAWGLDATKIRLEQLNQTRHRAYSILPHRKDIAQRSTCNSHLKLSEAIPNNFINDQLYLS